MLLGTKMPKKPCSSARCVLFRNFDIFENHIFISRMWGIPVITLGAQAGLFTITYIFLHFRRDNGIKSQSFLPSPQNIYSTDCSEV